MGKDTKAWRIAKYGEEAYNRRVEQSRAWIKSHRRECGIAARRWRRGEKGKKWYTENRDEHRQERKEWDEQHPERYEAKKREQGRKGGKYYEHHLKYEAEGLPHERKLIRMRHRNKWTPYKQIIAPESQLHHQWIPETASYTGLALVEADQHMHGFIDVIKILEGGITLFTEKEISEAPCLC